MELEALEEQVTLALPLSAQCKDNARRLKSASQEEGLHQEASNAGTMIWAS